MRGDWNAFAAREPYFAILTDPRFLRANFDPAAESAFFETGEQYVVSLYDTVLSGIASRFTPSTVLEYGCGAGRLLLPFARRAEHVTGVDVSPAMLETARNHVERSGLSNVELVDAAAFETDSRRFDLVNCFLVFQRMRPSEGLALLRSLARKVREGAVGVFHFPYHARVSPLTRAARRARMHVPGVNAVVNVVRGKPAATPLIETNTYDLNEVLAILQDIGYDAPRLVFTRHGDVDGVIVHARRKLVLTAQQPSSSVAATAAPEERSSPDESAFIDVRKMIAETPIERLNEVAEQYFSSLTDWEHHLAKPFARIDDAPHLLINVGVLLQGLQLTPGMTVLEYGAGTGWLSRFLAQLGCRMIVLDVSPTALEIARELFRLQPPIGSRPAPQFLTFDGLSIALPDASVDRVICFDSFHHAPNPSDVLREFARVLRPAGIAGFVEPGPRHSQTAQSQFEMRTYGVVENDIDVHAIWQEARRVGFAEIRMAAFNVPPFYVSLPEYEDLLASGLTFGRWAESTRAFLQDVRTFFMTKLGTAPVDSRKADSLRASIAAEVMTSSPQSGQPIPLRARVRNTGRAIWLPSTEKSGGVSLGTHLYDAAGHLIRFDYVWAAMPSQLQPGEEATVDLTLPPLERGRYIVELDCVAAEIAWFAQVGSPSTRLTIDVA